MIGAKSVSLCMVVYNQSELVQRAVKSLPIADEIIIVDQGSTPEHSSILEKLATKYHRTTNKGNADYDRQFCYSLATKDYIFALDADELIEEAELNKFGILISKFDIEAAWFLFKNEISSNGTTIDLKKLIGDDPHPRFWKKLVQVGDQVGPTLIWPHVAHKYPTINTGKQAFLSVFITHKRELSDVITTHLRRGQNIDPQAQIVEKQFMSAVFAEFGEEVFKSVKLKFPEIVNYLKGTSNGK